MDKNVNRGMYLTKIIQVPQKKIFTFGDTSFDYFVVSSIEEKSILRKGNLNCFRPTILTPDRMLEIFNGFSNEAIHFAEERYSGTLSKLRGLGYQFENNLKLKEEYTLNTEEVVQNILKENTEGKNNIAILNAPDDIWNLALVKVSFEIINNSFMGNYQDMEDRGYFQTPEERKRTEIELLFEEAEQNRSYIKELGKKLQDYELFEEYESRFFSLVNHR